MSIRTIDLHRQMELRSRAVATLGGDGRNAEEQLTAVSAFNVLHTLASSPTTAGDALAVLHELQVHQVELDLQHEEMQRAGAELEASLARQCQLYDHAPVALLSLDGNNRLTELNLAAVALLGQPREALVGRSLPDLLTPECRSALAGLLARARAADAASPDAVELAIRREPQVQVRATAGADPGGAGILLAFA